MSFIWISPYLWFGIAFVAAAAGLLGVGGALGDLFHQGEVFGLFEVIWNAIIPG
jgi:hypothetical protein